jgi:hypothetical protein
MPRIEVNGTMSPFTDGMICSLCNYGSNDAELPIVRLVHSVGVGALARWVYHRWLSEIITLDIEPDRG